MDLLSSLGKSVVRCGTLVLVSNFLVLQSDTNPSDDWTDLVEYSKEEDAIPFITPLFISESLQVSIEEEPNEGVLCRRCQLAEDSMDLEDSASEQDMPGEW